jgi:hypothetical protein
MIKREYRSYFRIGIVLSLWRFFIFKQFYPYPNIGMDSYGYLKAAVFDMGPNSFPIGYSRYLKFLIYFDWVPCWPAGFNGRLKLSEFLCRYW